MPAPDGICAPSSTIDDRALAMISGDAGDTVIPAGPYQAPAQQPRAMRTAMTTPAPMADRSAAAASRTREKVLRVVFQPYIDDRGRLHEATAVHTVVQSAMAGTGARRCHADPRPQRLRHAPTDVSLADAVDREAPGYLDIAAIDPNLPDPAVVAAARARRPDPVEAIKADVQTRLGRRAGGRRRSRHRPRHAHVSGSARGAVAGERGSPERRSGGARVQIRSGRQSGRRDRPPRVGPGGDRAADRARRSAQDVDRSRGEGAREGERGVPHRARSTSGKRRAALALPRP